MAATKWKLILFYFYLFFLLLRDPTARQMSSATFTGENVQLNY